MSFLIEFAEIFTGATLRGLLTGLEGTFVMTDRVSARMNGQVIDVAGRLALQAIAARIGDRARRAAFAEASGSDWRGHDRAHDSLTMADEFFPTTPRRR